MNDTQNQIKKTSDKDDTEKADGTEGSSKVETKNTDKTETPETKASMDVGTPSGQNMDVKA